MADEAVLSAVSLVHASGFAPALAPAVVLVFDESLINRHQPRNRLPRRLVSRLAGRGRRGDPRPFRAVIEIRPDVSLVCAVGPGSPTAAITVEFLAAFGVERLVVVGTAGDLHGSLSHATYPVSDAVADEGTSGHYGGDRRADEELTAQLAEALGRSPITTITTDVPFRHTPARLAEHRRVAAVVEMECAAVFAAARRFGLRAGALVVVADRFVGETWSLADADKAERELAAAIGVAAKTLGR